ncbi:hypothetical protein N0V93_001078 [Gnomoniopsis smithogilvyi]|uniref:Uncharacterized protein n=1 Tax=Gnomoniopsis smithogilvyi TaxID=1191159 RepID=A0A9W8Z2V1_9PEZI|nr:hypothetical protein N0V93_001078 [Gnomoniopsis smithogilvyi]
MSSLSTTPAANQGEAAATRFSTIYKAVMTPVIFVSFVASLAWVDFRYTVMRSHIHSDSTSRMPRWLHTLLYRDTPYQYVRVDRSKQGTPMTRDEGTKWHYHTKQRKLMKMEAEDAFRIRGSVLVILGLLAVAATWIAWQVSCRLWAAITTRVH